MQRRFRGSTGAIQREIRSKIPAARRYKLRCNRSLRCAANEKFLREVIFRDCQDDVLDWHRRQDSPNLAEGHSARSRCRSSGGRAAELNVYIVTRNALSVSGSIRALSISRVVPTSAASRM